MIVALAGGVGGAKLAHGLYRMLPPNELAVIVNTADDFDLFGLRICPDADTVMYTLAGLANPETGWGVVDDTFQTLDLLTRYGDDSWFRVGDRDFATHIARTERLRNGRSIGEVTAQLVAALEIKAAILPMCDEVVGTQVRTPTGTLEFQDYFVRRHHDDPVLGVTFRGIEAARVPLGVRQAIERADAIVFCPSNPIVSIGPILAVPGLRDAIASRRVPRIAVSPIVGGQAIRGPADRMLRGLGHEVSAFGVATLYRELIDTLVIDEVDAALAPRIKDLGMGCLIAPTVMTSTGHREQLAGRILELCSAVAAEPASGG